jgi:lipopolysaccharide/colanic/teichoic acid biosynthesis glycosyltransferase
MSVARTQSGKGLAAVAALEGAQDGAVHEGRSSEHPVGPARRARRLRATSLRLVQGGGSPARSARLRQLAADGAVRARRLAASVTRRVLEASLATALLLVLAPLLALLALAVRIESGGPALFRQRRIGRGRREFTVFKFRTMYRDADVAPHREYVQSLIEGDRGPDRNRLYKLSVDDRVTRVGRFLRSWSLDELPQLINVLRGEMAFVGPRPVIPYEVDMYPEEYLRRFDVRPGLTGLWQVSGRNERSYEEMVRLDIEYAANASLWGDVQILFKTVPVVLRRQGVA